MLSEGKFHMRLTLLFTTVSLAAASAATSSSKPTFAKDVAPIVFNRCAECHRPGEAAPMSLTSYKEVRPWAKAIKSAVLARRMPVWLADPAHGQFRNDRRLSQAEIDTITAWVDAGAPEGDAAQTPKLPEFVAGWSIGKPDQVFEMAEEFAVPSEGVVPYKYFLVPSGFTEDKWIQAAEIRPGERGVVHHIIVFVQTPGQTGAAGNVGNLLTGFAPGEQPMRLEPGEAKLVKAGSTFRLQLHYTPNGKAVQDRSRFGVVFAKQPPAKQAITANAINFAFKIPAGADNHEVKSSYTAKSDIEIVDFMPHMHVRGKDFKYTITRADGTQEVVLSVPKYDFNWQLGYALKEPLKLAKGDRIDCVAHYDNSPNNKYNPDPTKEVKWGDQTWEEMMIGWFTYTIPGPSASPAGPSTSAAAAVAGGGQ
jgi:hypothetical protein